jgi:hypothetical protein
VGLGGPWDATGRTKVARSTPSPYSCAHSVKGEEPNVQEGLNRRKGVKADRTKKRQTILNRAQATFRVRSVIIA